MPCCRNAPAWHTQGVAEVSAEQSLVIPANNVAGIRSRVGVKQGVCWACPAAIQFPAATLLACYELSLGVSGPHTFPPAVVINDVRDCVAMLLLTYRVC